MNQHFTHSTTPLPRPPAESFTFSAKERDSETGLSYFGSRYYSSDLSIWLSVDPMSAKYPSLSPYTYCADNPVKLVDPDGEEIFIYGKAKRAFFREVKSGAKALGISVKMDRFGKLSAKYNGKGPISEHGQLLLNAIKDRSVIVNIHTINNIGGTISCYMFGGAFGGNILIPQLTNGVWDYQFAIAKQTVIPSDLNILDYYYQSPGQSSLHEITEAYKGAVIAMNKKTLSSATGSNNPLFQQAHNTVIPQSGKIIKGLFDNNNNRVKDLETFRGVGFFEWQTANGELLKRTKVNFDNLEKIFN
jgi:RHS repeat-associated protein